jgi:hypothetical protein
VEGWDWKAAKLAFRPVPVVGLGLELWPYGPDCLLVELLALAAVLEMGLGVFRVAGLVIADVLEFSGIAIDGDDPVNVFSDGLRFQENMSLLGIFQPLLQPTCDPAMTVRINPKRTQFD